MSTNSFPPFGDIVVVTPGGSLQDGFEWDEMQMKVIMGIENIIVQ